MRSAGWLLRLRLGFSTCFLVLMLLVGYLGAFPLYRQQAPLMAVHTLLAAALMVAARHRCVLRWSWLALAFLDIPATFAIQSLTVRYSPNPGADAMFTLGICSLHVIGAQLSMQRRFVFTTAALTALAQAGLLLHVGLPQCAMFALVLIAAEAFGAAYLIVRVRELVQRAADETEQLIATMARASDEVAHPASPDDRSPSAPSAAEPAAPTAPEPGGSAKEPPE
jgi:hypothetical protein